MNLLIFQMVAIIIYNSAAQENELTKDYDKEYKSKSDAENNVADIQDHFYYDLDDVFDDVEVVEKFPRTDCFGACLNHFHDELNHGLGHENFVHLSSHYLPAIINVLGVKENFDTVCREFDGLLLCEDYCPDSASQFAHAAYLFRVYCTTYKKDINYNFSCLKSAEINENCEGQCLYPEYSLKYLASKFDDFYNSTPEVAFHSMDKACRQSYCDLSCMQKNALKSCGKYSSDLLSKLTTSTFDYLKSALQNTTKLKKWPESCVDSKDPNYKKVTMDYDYIQYNAYILQSPGMPLNNSSSILYTNCATILSATLLYYFAVSI